MKLFTRKAHRTIKAAKHPFLSKWRELDVPEGEKFSADNLRGAYDGKYLLLTDVMTEEEYSNGAPLSDHRAELFCEMLSKLSDISSDTDCLVIPCARYGLKANKASTCQVFSYLRDILPQSRVKAVLCVGMNAFAFTFAGGRKTHARTIIGNPMFMPQLYNLPVWVFPDIGRMFPTDSQDWKNVRFAQDSRDQMQNLMLNFQKFVGSKLT